MLGLSCSTLTSFFFLLLYSKLLFFLNPFSWIKKNQQQYCTITWAQVYPCHEFLGKLELKLMMQWKYITEPNVQCGCTVWEKKRRKNEERMTYNITESLCVALKLFTKKTTQEHRVCATVVAYFALSKISLVLFAPSSFSHFFFALDYTFHPSNETRTSTS